MKKIILILLLSPILIEAFKNSDVRKELRIPLNTFQNISKQIYDGKNYNYKNAIGFTKNNSKEFLKKVKEVYKQWHGNDKEMILILSKNDIINDYQTINKQP